MVLRRLFTHRKRTPETSYDAGFTLLELLVVLVIIGLISGLVGPQVMKLLGKAKSDVAKVCLLYTSPSPRDRTRSRMPSSA